MPIPIKIGRRALKKDQTPKSPQAKPCFFENLTLKALTYDPEKSYADDVASPQLPLNPHSFLEGERKLEYIFKLGYLPEEVEFFFSESKTFMQHEREIFKLKLPIAYDPSEMSKAFGFDPYYISDRRDVVFALEHGPIRSAEKLAALLNKDTASLHFTMLRRDPLLQADGIDPMLFTCFNPITNERNFVRCIVVPLAPWEFTSEDFNKFTKLGIFTESDDNTDLMWSYLHDVCTIYECDYFILTTYENWAFGRFSHTYAQALISEPISRTSKDLVMKYLTYWILNSCYTPDTAVIQEVFQHELEYFLVKITEKTSNGEPGGERYQLAMVNHERVTGRPISPDPFPDYDSEPELDEGMLEKPCDRFNKWHKRECQECATHLEEQGHFDGQDWNDNEMEEREIADEIIPDRDISESSSGSLTGTRISMDVEIDQDIGRSPSLTCCQTISHPRPSEGSPGSVSEISRGASEDAEVIQDIAPDSVPQAKDETQGYVDCEAGPSDFSTESTAERQVEVSMDVDIVPAQDIVPTSPGESDTSGDLGGIQTSHQVEML